MVLELTYSGHRADLILNRPDVLNAMSPEVFDALATATAELATRPDVRVVVVSGAGRSFSSGIDTSSFGGLGGATSETVERAQAGFRRLAALPMPTIAAVRGHALGAGLQVALACDVRVITTDASVGLLETRYGIIPDCGGTQKLPLLIGAGRAKRMIWLAERITGEQAGEIGLAEIVVEPDQLDKTVDELARALTAIPPLAARETKRLVDLAGRVSHEEGMDEEQRSQLLMLNSQDFGEAIAAFIEKRSGNYSGR